MSRDLPNIENGGDSALQEAVHEKLLQKLQTVTDSFSGRFNTEETRKELEDAIKEKFKEFGIVSECKSTNVDVNDPTIYNPDKDLHRIQSYEEYKIIKDMKNQDAVDEQEFTKQKNLVPGSLSVDVKIELPRPIEMIRLNHVITGKDLNI